MTKCCCCDFRTIEAFTGTASVLIFLQATYASGLIPATLETWEIAFQLTTSQLAPVLTLYVVAKLVVGLPLTFYCSSPVSWAIPRHLAWMFATIGFTALLTGLPWLMAAVEDTGAASPNVCYLNGHPANAAGACATDAEGASGLVYLVFVAQFLNGIAASCLYSLVPSFIESNTDSSRGTKYLSFFLASGPLGVAFGFMAQGMAVNAGMWGALFLVVGVLLMVISCVMWQFPETFDGAEEAQQHGRLSSSSSGDNSGGGRGRRSSMVLANATMKEGLRSFARDAAIILQNGVWWLFALAASVEAFFVVGINNYGPKIFSSYFSISTGAGRRLGTGFRPRTLPRLGRRQYSAPTRSATTYAPTRFAATYNLVQAGPHK